MNTTFLKNEIVFNVAKRSKMNTVQLLNNKTVFILDLFVTLNIISYFSKFRVYFVLSPDRTLFDHLKEMRAENDLWFFPVLYTLLNFGVNCG